MHMNQYFYTFYYNDKQTLLFTLLRLNDLLCPLSMLKDVWLIVDDLTNEVLMLGALIGVRID